MPTIKTRTANAAGFDDNDAKAAGAVAIGGCSTLLFVWVSQMLEPIVVAYFILYVWTWWFKPLIGLTIQPAIVMVMAMLLRILVMYVKAQSVVFHALWYLLVAWAVHTYLWS